MLLNRFRSSVRNFLQFQDGNFAMMLGLAFLPLMAMVGVALDYTRMVRAETALASALDSAILAVGKQLPLTEQQVLDLAENFMQLNLPSPGVFEGPTVIEVVNLDAKHVELKVSNTLPTIVMQLFNQDEIDIEATAEASKDFPALEVVLVLDNSNSMNGQKLTDLKAAAAGMINDLFGTASTSNTLRIGLVPFSEYVNIKPTTANYQGSTPNFNVNSTVDPLAADPLASKSVQDSHIASHYTGSAWNWMDITGEAKYNGWNTDDHRFVGSGGTGGTHAKRGSSYTSAYTTAPFEFRTVSPGGARYTDGGGHFAPCLTTSECDYEAVRSDHFWLYEQLKEFNVPWEGCVESRPIVDQNNVTRDYDILDVPPSLLYPDTLFVPVFQPDGSGGGYHDWLEERGEYNGSSDTPSGDIPRLYHLDKYYQNNPALDTSASDEGPSRKCPQALTPLVNVKSAVLNSINSMYTIWDTNIPAGLVWGWRVLSPAEPFTAGLPYHHTDAQGIEWKKVIIVLTDGENMSSTQSYNSYGYWEESRLTGPTGTADVRLGMDDRLADLCKNVKDAGQPVDANVANDSITLYVIAFEMSSSATENLFKPCATSEDHFFEPASGAELTQVFDAIGADLAKLRLTK